MARHGLDPWETAPAVVVLKPCIHPVAGQQLCQQSSTWVARATGYVASVLGSGEASQHHFLEDTIGRNSGTVQIRLSFPVNSLLAIGGGEEHSTPRTGILWHSHGATCQTGSSRVAQEVHPYRFSGGISCFLHL